MNTINQLYENPRWYHVLFTNCTTSFYKLPSTKVRWDWRVIANARLDRALYQDGRLDRTLPFEELRRLAYLNDIANTAPAEGLGTTSAANSKGAAMNDEVIPLLKVHEYFQGAWMRPSRKSRASDGSRIIRQGSVVHEADVVLTTVGFVLRGRLKAVRVSTNGTESLFRMIERGEQFGMMVGALDESVPIRVVALSRRRSLGWTTRRRWS